MSFWDKYLAPGDIRSRQQHTPPPPPPQPEPATRKPLPLERIGPAHRARRQNALFYGGLVFTFLSLFITRRSLIRKKLQAPPIANKDGTTPPTTTKADGSLEAVEALGLATLNVFSVAMASAGAAMKYFDVADVEDLREGVRKSMGYDVYGGTEQDADNEIEAWIAEVLSKKDGNLREGVVEKLAELEEQKKLKADGEQGKR